MTDAEKAQFYLEELKATRAILFGLLNNLSPSWFNMMGKVGYECPACERMTKRQSEFKDASKHAADCYLIVAEKLRGEPYPTTMQPGASRLLAVEVN